jgi:hypothetical protein
MENNIIYAIIFAFVDLILLITCINLYIYNKIERGKIVIKDLKLIKYD